MPPGCMEEMPDQIINNKVPGQYARSEWCSRQGADTRSNTQTLKLICR